MAKKRLLYILICFMSFNLMAMTAKLQGKLTILSPDDGTVEIGDHIEGVFEIWPLPIEENLDVSFFEQKFLSEFLYINRLANSERSKNNSEVLQIRFDGIIYKEIQDTTLQVLELPSGKLVPFFIHKLKIKTNNKKYLPTFLFQDENIYVELNNSKLILLIILAIVGLFCFLMLSKYFFKKMRLKKNEQITLRQYKIKWNKKFQTARSRNDYEYIYKNKNEWLKLAQGLTPPIQTFFSILNNSQYKKKWSEENDEEVSFYFDEIRDIFRQ